VSHLLESDFTLVLANATNTRQVPGRKGDVNDAVCTADLMAHGLIRGRFGPPTAVQERRDLARTRIQPMHELARHTLRIQKTLEDANLKLTRVLSDVPGGGGHAIVQAPIDGETDPERSADFPLAEQCLDRRIAGLTTLAPELRAEPRPKRGGRCRETDA